jgi:hypothetical protein
MPHCNNQRQRSMNDFWLCILGNLGGNGLQTSLNEILATLSGKNKIGTLPAPGRN